MNRLSPTGWLGRRVDRAISVTIPACLDQLEKTGRIGNLEIAAGRRTGEIRGRRYDDSDVWKTVEAGARALLVRDDAGLRARLEAIVELASAAASPDGYLDTWFQVKEPERRFTDIESGHELYVAGHLIEAGVEWRRATGDRALLDVAVRFAERIDAMFGPGRRPEPPGHPEIEPALAKLFRATGERRWLDLALHFLKARGRHDGRTSYGEYAQDHLPLREQREAKGHAVRELYLLLGAADVAALLGDEELLAAVRAVFEDLTERKSYITGGVGSSAKNEGFGEAFDLPIDGAYCETCAGIGVVLVAARLLDITGEAVWADRMELALENAVLPGVSLAGDRFHYRNPLADDGSTRRAPWFPCACCPTNVARFLPRLAEFVLAPAADGPAVALYAPGEFTAETAGGPVRLTIETSYPLEGTVFLTLAPGKPRRFPLRLRVPGWLGDSPTLRVNGTPTQKTEEGGWLRVERDWSDGDVVALGLPMVPRVVTRDPRVGPDRDLVALRRGPLVFCVEGTDHGGDLAHARLPEGARLRTTWDADLPGGTVSLRWESPRGRCRAIPYAHWGHRTADPMAVWMRR